MLNLKWSFVNSLIRYLQATTLQVIISSFILIFVFANNALFHTNSHIVPSKIYYAIITYYKKTFVKKKFVVFLLFAYSYVPWHIIIIFRQINLYFCVIVII